MNARDCQAWLVRRFDEAGLSYGHGTDNASDEAWWLMHHVLFGSEEFGEIPAMLELDDTAMEAIELLAEQRIRSRQPLAYLTGTGWFCGLPFEVNNRVLVPRSPLAELIMQGFDPVLSEAPRRILDLCTGSGCIGIACAMAFPQAQVVLSDISAEALEIARRNIHRHGLSQRVSSCNSDLFASIQGRFDLIVTNPPYVSRSEYQDLPAEYHREPELGLVTEKDGLDIPLQILDRSAEFLEEGGVLVLEVGNTWEALDAARPDLPFLWLEFANGGLGVCALPENALRSSD